MSLLPESVVPLLPFAIPVGLMTYVLIVAFGGTIRQRRRRKMLARRKSDSRPPWQRWLDEINQQKKAGKRPSAIEKWRE